MIIPDTSPASGPLTIKNISFDADNGIVLQGKQYWSDQYQPRGHLVFVHGACEHAGRYQWFFELAANKGWRVTAVDLRGHGSSTGDVVHVDNFKQYVEDMSLVVGQHSSEEPLVIVANSMGGLITIRWLQTYAEQVGARRLKKVVLLSPLLAIKHPISPWKIAAGTCLSRYRPRTQFRSTLRPEQLTRDLDVLAQKKNDPLIRKAVTARWYTESEQAMQQAFADAARVKAPILLMQSELDLVVDPLASKAWAEKVNSCSKEESNPIVDFRLCERAYHEILCEPNRKLIAAKLLQELGSD